VSSERPTVLTVGETMALLDPSEDGRFRVGMGMTLRFAGAESNFAVGLCRLGIPTAWVSRLGRDALGDMVLDGLRAEGVELRWVTRGVEPTGLFLKQRREGRSSSTYYRRGSAASGLQPEDVPDEALDGVRLVHLTGITMAISEGGRRTVLDVARRAKERGALVVFDPNFRAALPDTPEECAARQREVLPLVDWYLCSEDERRLLWGGEEIPVPAAIRVGARGALVAGTEVPPPQAAEVVDDVGAGDAFAAGFAYGLLHGWSPVDCARAGNLIAAGALAGTGDWETLPRLGELGGALAPSG
jgi:2-dehydro-3-deoxygluconokinase